MHREGRAGSAAAVALSVIGLLLASTAFAGRQRMPVMVLGSVENVGTVRAIAPETARNVAAVASTDQGLLVLDLAGLDQGAQPVKTRHVLSGLGYGVALSDGTAYVIEAFSGSPPTAKLKVVDVRAPRAPVVFATLNLAGALTSGAVAVNGSTLYVGATDAGLQVFDIRNPRSPALVRTLPVSGRIEQIVLNGQMRAAFVRSTTSQKAFDVTNPLSPVALFEVGTSGLSSIATIGNRVYRTASRSLTVLEYASLSPPVLAGAVHSMPWDASVVTGPAGVFVSQAAEVWMVDLSDKKTLNVQHKLLTAGYVRAMATESDRLFAADTTSKLTIFQIR